MARHLFALLLSAATVAAVFKDGKGTENRARLLGKQSSLQEYIFAALSGAGLTEYRHAVQFGNHRQSDVSHNFSFTAPKPFGKSAQLSSEPTPSSSLILKRSAFSPSTEPSPSSSSTPSSMPSPSASSLPSSGPSPSASPSTSSSVSSSASPSTSSLASPSTSPSTSSSASPSTSSNASLEPSSKPSPEPSTSSSWKPLPSVSPQPSSSESSKQYPEISPSSTSPPTASTSSFPFTEMTSYGEQSASLSMSPSATNSNQGEPLQFSTALSVNDSRSFSPCDGKSQLASCSPSATPNTSFLPKEKPPSNTLDSSISSPVSVTNVAPGSNVSDSIAPTKSPLLTGSKSTSGNKAYLKASSLDQGTSKNTLSGSASLSSSYASSSTFNTDAHPKTTSSAFPSVTPVSSSSSSPSAASAKVDMRGIEKSAAEFPKKMDSKKEHSKMHTSVSCSPSPSGNLSQTTKPTATVSTLTNLGENRGQWKKTWTKATITPQATPKYENQKKAQSKKYQSKKWNSSKANSGPKRFVSKPNTSRKPPCPTNPPTSRKKADIQYKSSGKKNVPKSKTWKNHRVPSKPEGKKYYTKSEPTKKTLGNSTANGKRKYHVGNKPSKSKHTTHKKNLRPARWKKTVASSNPQVKHHSVPPNSRQKSGKPKKTQRKPKLSQFASSKNSKNTAKSSKSKIREGEHSKPHSKTKHCSQASHHEKNRRADSLPSGSKGDQGKKSHTKSQYKTHEVGSLGNGRPVQPHHSPSNEPSLSANWRKNSELDMETEDLSAYSGSTSEQNAVHGPHFHDAEISSPEPEEPTMMPKAFRERRKRGAQNIEAEFLEEFVVPSNGPSLISEKEDFQVLEDIPALSPTVSPVQASSEPSEPFTIELNSDETSSPTSIIGFHGLSDEAPVNEISHTERIDISPTDSDISIDARFQMAGAGYSSDRSTSSKSSSTASLGFDIEVMPSFEPTDSLPEPSLESFLVFKSIVPSKLDSNPNLLSDAVAGLQSVLKSARAEEARNQKGTAWKGTLLDINLFESLRKLNFFMTSETYQKSETSKRARRTITRLMARVRYAHSSEHTKLQAKDIEGIKSLINFALGVLGGSDLPEPSAEEDGIISSPEPSDIPRFFSVALVLFHFEKHNSTELVHFVVLSASKALGISSNRVSVRKMVFPEGGNRSRKRRVGIILEGDCFGFHECNGLQQELDEFVSSGLLNKALATSDFNGSSVQMESLDSFNKGLPIHSEPNDRKGLSTLQIALLSGAGVAAFCMVLLMSSIFVKHSGGGSVSHSSNSGPKRESIRMQWSNALSRDHRESSFQYSNFGGRSRSDSEVSPWMADIDHSTFGTLPMARSNLAHTASGSTRPPRGGTGGSVSDEEHGFARIPTQKDSWVQRP